MCQTEKDMLYAESVSEKERGTKCVKYLPFYILLNTIMMFKLLLEPPKGAAFKIVDC